MEIPSQLSQASTAAKRTHKSAKPKVTKRAEALASLIKNRMKQGLDLLYGFAGRDQAQSHDALQLVGRWNLAERSWSAGQYDAPGAGRA